MAESFEFIDNSSLDRVSRKKIRSHVMKGKNLGKRCPRRSRQVAPPSARPFRTPRMMASMRRQQSVSRVEQSDQINDRDSGEENLKTEESHEMNQKSSDEVFPLRLRPGNTVAQAFRAPEMVTWANQLVPVQTIPHTTLQMLKQTGSRLACWSFSFEVTPYIELSFYNFTQVVAHTLYPPAFCKSSEWLQTIWFHLMFVDEAYFHCSLALIMNAIDIAIGNTEITHKNRLLTVKAFKLINLKLSSMDPVSDVAIASVITLCLLSDLHRRHAETLVHFKGLCKMIELRGGIPAVYDKPYLLEKIHRIDLDLALHLGTAPQFGPVHPVPPTTNPHQHGRITKDECALAVYLKDINTQLAAIAEDMFMFTQVLNATTEETKLDGTAYQELVLSLLYRLLDISTILKPTLKSPIERACHLGMVAFMSTLLFRFDSNYHIQYTMVLEAYQEVLQVPSLFDTVPQDLRLWLLTVEVIIVSRKIRTDWYPSQLVASLPDLGIETWEHAQALLQRYPWVKLVHDQRARTALRVNLNARQTRAARQ